MPNKESKSANELKKEEDKLRQVKILEAYRIKVINYLESEEWITNPLNKVINTNPSLIKKEGSSKYNNSIDAIKNFLERKEYLILQGLLINVYNNIFEQLKNGGLHMLLSDELKSHLTHEVDVSADFFIKNVKNIAYDHMSEKSVQSFLNDFLQLKIDIDAPIEVIINREIITKSGKSDLEKSYIIFNNNMLELMYGENVDLTMEQRELMESTYSHFIFKDFVNTYSNSKNMEDSISKLIIRERLVSDTKLSYEQLDKLADMDMEYVITYLLNKPKDSKERNVCFEVISKKIFSLNLDEDDDIHSIFYVLSDNEKETFKKFIITEALEIIKRDGNLNGYKKFLNLNDIDVFKRVEKEYHDHLIEEKIIKDGIENLLELESAPSINFKLSLKKYVDLFGNEDIKHYDGLYLHTEGFVIMVEKNTQEVIFQVRDSELVSLGEEKCKQFVNHHMLALKSSMDNEENFESEQILRTFLLEHKMTDKNQKTKAKKKL